MSPIERIHEAVEDLLARDVARRTAAPLAYRFLWFLGIPVRPPLYQSYLALLLLHGFLFGGVLGAILACADRRLAPDGATVLGTLGGAIYGIMMATYYRLRAWSLGLPAWDENAPDWRLEEDGW